MSNSPVVVGGSPRDLLAEFKAVKNTSGTKKRQPESRQILAQTPSQRFKRHLSFRDLGDALEQGSAYGEGDSEFGVEEYPESECSEIYVEGVQGHASRQTPRKTPKRRLSFDAAYDSAEADHDEHHAIAGLHSDEAMQAVRDRVARALNFGDEQVDQAFGSGDRLQPVEPDEVRHARVPKTPKTPKVNRRLDFGDTLVPESVRRGGQSAVEHVVATGEYDAVPDALPRDAFAGRIKTPGRIRSNSTDGQIPSLDFDAEARKQKLENTARNTSQLCHVAALLLGAMRYRVSGDFRKNKVTSHDADRREDQRSLSDFFVQNYTLDKRKGFNNGISYFADDVAPRTKYRGKLIQSVRSVGQDDDHKTQPGSPKAKLEGLAVIVAKFLLPDHIDEGGSFSGVKRLWAGFKNTLRDLGVLVLRRHPKRRALLLRWLKATMELLYGRNAVDMDEYLRGAAGLSLILRENQQHWSPRDRDLLGIPRALATDNPADTEIAPAIHRDTGLFSGLSDKQRQKVLNANPYTSPRYSGVLQNVKTIAGVKHALGIGEEIEDNQAGDLTLADAPQVDQFGRDLKRPEIGRNYRKFYLGSTIGTPYGEEKRREYLKQIRESGRQGGDNNLLSDHRKVYASVDDDCTRGLYSENERSREKSYYVASDHPYVDALVDHGCNVQLRKAHAVLEGPLPPHTYDNYGDNVLTERMQVARREGSAKAHAKSVREMRDQSSANPSPDKQSGEALGGVSAGGVFKVPNAMARSPRKDPRNFFGMTVPVLSRVANPGKAFMNAAGLRQKGGGRDENTQRQSVLIR